MGKKKDPEDDTPANLYLHFGLSKTAGMQVTFEGGMVLLAQRCSGRHRFY
jgi:hypothetical protein